MAFFAIWWAWMNYTWFASAYDNDDVGFRLLTFVIMSGALLLAAGVPGPVRRRLVGHRGGRLRGHALRDGGAVAARRRRPPRAEADRALVRGRHRRRPGAVDRPARGARGVVGADLPPARRRRAARPGPRRAQPRVHAVPPAPHRRALRAARDHRPRRGDPLLGPGGAGRHRPGVRRIPWHPGGGTWRPTRPSPDPAPEGRSGSGWHPSSSAGCSSSSRSGGPTSRATTCAPSRRAAARCGCSGTATTSSSRGSPPWARPSPPRSTSCRARRRPGPAPVALALAVSLGLVALTLSALHALGDHESVRTMVPAAAVTVACLLVALARAVDGDGRPPHGPGALGARRPSRLVDRGVLEEDGR